jgi:hypothetical protein
MSGNNDFSKLVNILNRTLSDADGEVVNASRAARRAMLRMGISNFEELFDVLANAAVLNFKESGATARSREHPKSDATKQEQKTKRRPTDDDRAYAAFCHAIFDHPDFEGLDEWKRSRIEEWMQKTYFTEKMRAKIEEIGRKLGLKLAPAADKATADTSPHDREYRERQQHFHTI